MLTEIVRELERRASGPAIDAARVRDWMRSQDAEVRGATYVLLGRPPTSKRIEPALTFDDVFEFTLDYYRWCLEHDRQGEYVDSRYTAGWDMVGWVCGLVDSDVPPRYLDRVKRMLEQVFLTGGQDVRRCITDATLEHLFERGDIAQLFRDWKDHPELSVAYREAREWIEGGGSSPLTKRKQKPRDR